MSKRTASGLPGTEPVPGVLRPGEDADLMRAARIAGLRGFVVPTLDRIDRRRNELLIVTFGLLVVLTVAIAGFTLNDTAFAWFVDENRIPGPVSAGLVLLVLGFAVYVLDKERRLRRLAKYVVNEQVLSAALSNRIKELAALSEAGKAVSSSLDLDEVLAVILNAVSELLNADEGSIMLVEGSELAVAAGFGHPRLFIGARQGLDEGIAGYVARTREPLLLEGGSHVQSLPAGPDPGEIISAMSVPLQVRTELLGILNLNIRDGERRFTEYELHALSLFGEHAAMAIRHGRTMRREREMRAHVAEADRLRTELVGSMAHDLKSPLTTILGASRILTDRWEQLDETRRKEFLTSVTRQGERLLAQIERLLDAARSQAQHLPLEPVPIDVTALLREAVESHASAYTRTIGFTCAAPLIQGLADAEALQQIVSNLLENAMRHTPADTPVDVHVESDEDAVSITVADKGPGIPEDDLPKLFTPFRRGDGGRGTGLGLFVVANLARAIGGGVTVDSTEGGGTSFTFTIPAYPPAD